jgi:hypothetical protein
VPDEQTTVRGVGAGSEPIDLRLALLRTGVPVPLAEELARCCASLSEAAAALPVARALPRAPGSLIAVVGPDARARALARAVARELGIAEAEIARAVYRRRPNMLAKHLVAHRPEDAADLAPGWRRDRVGVVAVCLPQRMQRALPWARAMLHALAPSMTLLQASALCKTEDIAAVEAAIGGADALWLEHTPETLSPASPLACGCPAAYLDGAPANAHSWEAVLRTALLRQEGR